MMVHGRSIAGSASCGAASKPGISGWSLPPMPRTSVSYLTAFRTCTSGHALVNDGPGDQTPSASRLHPKSTLTPFCQLNHDHPARKPRLGAHWRPPLKRPYMHIEKEQEVSAFFLVARLHLDLLVIATIRCVSGTRGVSQARQLSRAKSKHT